MSHPKRNQYRGTFSEDGDTLTGAWVYPGGGVIGDVAGLPKSRLAVLPGTTHITLVHRADWLGSMIGEFLDV